MIDPAKLKPSLVEPAAHALLPEPVMQGEQAHIARGLAAFLNALLADDEAMERAYSAFGKCQAYSDKERARAAIIAAVTEGE